MVAPEKALGLLETTGLTPALVALDVIEKAADVQLVQAEVNDFLGIVLKVSGPLAAIKTAIAAGHAAAQRFGGRPTSDVVPRPDEQALTVIVSAAEYNPLIQQDVVLFPRFEPAPQRRPGGIQVSEPDSFALGFIETQGFTAVFEAVDSACKAANVEVVGKEKLGGGYVTVIVRGDVAAVKAAVEAGQRKVDGLGKLIAAHVIARPSASVLALLPQRG